MKIITIPARQIPEQTLDIVQIMLIPSQSRIIVQTSDINMQLERTVSPEESDTIISIATGAVTDKYPEATVAEKVVEAIVKEPVTEPVIEELIP
uniref:Uncharacterized protein n=1 Tax=viral metagenome TaxID=1070528 RepID=A0A6M3XW25_9ZZZZ